MNLFELQEDIQQMIMVSFISGGIRSITGSLLFKYSARPLIKTLLSITKKLKNHQTFLFHFVLYHISTVSLTLRNATDSKHCQKVAKFG